MIPSINQISIITKTDHVMHSQKKLFLGNAMVKKNHSLSTQGLNNQSELLQRVQHIFVCNTLIDSIHQSGLKKKVKTDHIMHLQKFSILGGAMVEKNQFFSDPGPSNQSELLRRVLQIIVCSTLIYSIHQSGLKKKKLSMLCIRKKL